MYKINLYSVGKSKEPWLSQALLLYKNRLKSKIQLNFHWVKTTEHLSKALEKETLIYALDPRGDLLTSEEFADKLRLGFEKNGCELALVIGGVEGLPSILKKHPLISLSKMIFTHQLSRIIVAEQIYRAVQIWNNSPYHFS